jgi:hypothetical protein
MMKIRISVERERKCGYRKPGGLYLVSCGFSRYCGALPIALEVCPACHQGIHPARGWTWVNLKALRGDKPCVQSINPSYCDSCAFFFIEKAGLLWVGEKYYKTPEDFNREGVEMGISRRISQIPREFKLGETWVAFAHRKAIPQPFTLAEEPAFKAGIFHLFKPTAIEYIVQETDTDSKLEALEKRGITLVKVIKDTANKQKCA